MTGTAVSHAGVMTFISVSPVNAKIYRGDELIATTDIHSVKIVKDDVKEALKDRECGIKFGYEGYAVGDRIECFSLKRIED